MRISIVLSSLLIASQAYAIKYPTGKLQQPVVTKSVAAPVKAVTPVLPKATPVAKVKTVTTTKTTTTISKSDTIKKTVVKTIISSKKTEAVAPKKIVIEKKITKIIDTVFSIHHFNTHIHSALGNTIDIISFNN